MFNKLLETKPDVGGQREWIVLRLDRQFSDAPSHSHKSYLNVGT